MKSLQLIDSVELGRAVVPPGCCVFTNILIQGLLILIWFWPGDNLGLEFSLLLSIFCDFVTSFVSNIIVNHARDGSWVGN